MDKRQVMKSLLSQMNLSYLEAKEEGVENITLYKEAYEKLSALSKRSADYDDVIDKNLKFATYGNIRSNVKIDAAISIATRFLSSKWASSKGRQDIYDKAIESGTKHFRVSESVYKEGVDIIKKYEQDIKEQKKKALNAIDVFENETLPDLEEKWRPPSDVVFEAVELAKARDLGADYVQDALDYVEKNAGSLNDLDSMRDSLYEFFEDIIDSDDEL